MNFKLPAGLRIPTINRRQIIVIITLLAPPVIIFGLIPHNRNIWTQAPPKKVVVNKDYPFLTLEYLRTATSDLAKKSESVTPEEYAQWRLRNPQLPSTLEAYRMQVKERLKKLQDTTQEQWEQDFSERVPRMVRGTGAFEKSTVDRPNPFSPIPKVDELRKPSDLPPDNTIKP